MGIFDIKHWLVVLVVVILLFGTKRLKTLGSDVGEAIKGFRQSMKSGQDEASPVPADNNLTKPREIHGEKLHP